MRTRWTSTGMRCSDSRFSATAGGMSRCWSRTISRIPAGDGSGLSGCAARRPCGVSNSDGMACVPCTQQGSLRGVMSQGRNLREKCRIWTSSSHQIRPLSLPHLRPTGQLKHYLIRRLQVRQRRPPPEDPPQGRCCGALVVVAQEFQGVGHVAWTLVGLNPVGQGAVVQAHE